MPTTTEILSVATSTNNMLAQASGGFDVWKDIVAPIVIVVFSMLLERWFGITKWPSRIVAKIVQKSPQRIRQSVFALGLQVNVTQAAQQEGGGVELGTSEQALGAPISLPNERRDMGTQGFILTSIIALLGDESARLMVRSDYESGIQWVQNGDNRGAASSLVRAYNPVLRVLDDRGHTTDANALRREISKLSQFGISGVQAEDITTTLSNIDTIFHAYFQQNR